MKSCGSGGDGRISGVGVVAVEVVLAVVMTARIELLVERHE